MKTLNWKRVFVLAAVAFLSTATISVPKALAVDNPTEIRFIVSHADCSLEMSSTFEFFVSGVSVGVHSSTQPCECNINPLVVTLNDPATLSLIRRIGCTPVSVTLNDPTLELALGFVRVEIDRAESGTEILCLVDYLPGGNCGNRDLCDASDMPGTSSYSNFPDCPDPLTVTPADGLSSSGYEGGPFTLASKNYTLVNIGPDSLDWTAGATAAWVTVSPANGSLATGASVNVEVSLNSNANSLPQGSYNDIVTFTNINSGSSQTRDVHLIVNLPPQPPSPPANPDPYDGATDVPVDKILAWSNGTTNAAVRQNVQPKVRSVVKPSSAVKETSIPKVTFVHANGLGGPDAGGYTFIDSDETGGPSFNWIEISGMGANLNLSDDSYFFPIDLPFNFNFYNTGYSQVAVASNGTIYFENTYLGFTNACIPGTNGSGIQRFIAVYWDDLYPSGTNNVYYQIVGSAPNRILVVQWQNVSHYGGGGAVTAQAQLFENGNILLLYANPSSEAGMNAVVGIQNDSSTGLEYLCYQASLHSGLAILFTCSGGITYDVYFDTAYPPETLISSGLTTPHCEPVPYPLAHETTYYWQVIANNAVGQAVGPVWSFSTVAPLGEINVTDSIPPINDMNMPFSNVFTGSSRTEQVTITNTDPFHALQINSISLGNQYFEDFEDGLAQNWLPTDPTIWSVVSGEYQASTPLLEVIMQSTYTGHRWHNCTAQMQVHRTGFSSSASVLVVRAQDDFDWATEQGSAYLIGISGRSDYYVLKYVNGYGSWVQDWTYSPYLNPDPATNIVKVSIDGENITVFLNDNVVWSGTDSSIPNAGKVGLLGYSSSYSPYTVHYFDNVSVTENPLSETTLSAEQQWYNAHPYSGGTFRSAPEGWRPPQYTGQNYFTKQVQSTTPDTGFSLQNTPSLPVTIPGGGNITFNVNFTPQQVRSYASTIVIVSDDTDEPELEVQLSGTGILDYMTIAPDANCEFSGHPGGPFMPSNISYWLSNNGAANINWVAAGPDWLNISPASGTIKPADKVKVTVSPNAQARNKGEGKYNGQLLFTDVTTSVVQNRTAVLNIYTAPKIWVTPSSFDVTVVQGDSVDKTLTIGNAGDGLLNFTLTSKQTGFTSSSTVSATAGAAVIETKKDIVALAPPKHSFTTLATNAPFEEGRMLVRFAPQTDRTWPGQAVKKAVLAKAGHGEFTNASIAKEYKHVKGLSLVKLPGSMKVKDAIVTLNNTPGILYAEPDYKLKALSVPQNIPNDPMFSELWAMHNTGQTGGIPGADINAPQAWDTATGISDVVVAVIDTGVDYTHQDLAANIWINPGEIPGNGIDDDHNGYIDDVHGYDFVNNDNDPMDDFNPVYHGTHVSGTIGAVGNNGQGVAGVNWHVKIMALKFLDAGGNGSTSGAVEAVQYATAMGAKLSSNSWGGGDYSQALKDAIDAAGAANQLFVAAAGNDYGNNNDINPAYPASYTSANIISVLATDMYDNMSDFSNYGPTSVDIGAPGSDILSCQAGNNYQYLSGTSMATPHVSGAAALAWSVCPTLPYTEVKDILLRTVDTTPSMAGRCVSAGRLDLANAVKEISLPWIEFVPRSGLAQAGETTNATIIFHGDVPPGTYQGQVTVATNDPYTPEITIPVTMTVKPGDFFTELFDSANNDLANRTLTFVPNGSVNYYSLCTHPSSGFPVDPANGTPVTLRDDDYQEIQLQGQPLSLYGTSYDTFYIGSNGYITFSSGDIHYLEEFTEHFALPRISALFDDLNPAAGGVISWQQLTDSVVVTFQDVPEFSSTGKNSFQIEMFFNGKIRITMLNIAAIDGLAGLSEGLGVPNYFNESDLSNHKLSCDLNHDCDVDFSDYSLLTYRWQSTNCNAGNQWCNGSDLQQDGNVNWNDIAELVAQWLE